jgi:hypothetical protein
MRLHFKAPRTGAFLQQPLRAKGPAEVSLFVVLSWCSSERPNDTETKEDAENTTLKKYGYFSSNLAAASAKTTRKSPQSKGKENEEPSPSKSSSRKRKRETPEPEPQEEPAKKYCIKELREMIINETNECDRKRQSGEITAKQVKQIRKKCMEMVRRFLKDTMNTRSERIGEIIRHEAAQGNGLETTLEIASLGYQKHEMREEFRKLASKIYSKNYNLANAQVMLDFVLLKDEE